MARETADLVSDGETSICPSPVLDACGEERFHVIAIGRMGQKKELHEAEIGDKLYGRPARGYASLYRYKSANGVLTNLCGVKGPLYSRYQEELLIPRL